MSRRGSKWLPFFLVLLFYQVGLGGGTSPDQGQAQTVTPSNPEQRTRVAMERSTRINTITTNSIPTGSTRNVDVNAARETRPMQWSGISNEIPTVSPNSPSTASEVGTISRSRDVTAVTSSIGSPPVLAINLDRRVEPVTVTHRRPGGKTVFGGRIRPLVAIDKPARRHDLVDVGVNVDASIPEPLTLHPDSDETKEIQWDVIEDTPPRTDKQLKYLTNYIEQRHGTKIDFEKLLTQYTQVCPVSEQCNLITPSIQEFKSTFQNEFECPYFCLCGIECLSSGICCPGSIYAYTEYECLNVQVPPQEGKSGYYMVATCPATYKDKTIRRMCEGHVDSSGTNQNVQPVTSRETILTYKNRFCSICHGESNITEWTISVKCPEKGLQPVEDFDSYSEMKEYLEKNKCELAYDLDKYELVPPACQPPSEDAVKPTNVGECNATGLWRNEDSDIRWACEHFDGRPFLNFKNVYCFLCNPSIISTHTPLSIDQCNITNDWDVYDAVLESACLNQPALPRLFPYKNVYCLMCNGVSTLFRVNLYRTDTMEVSVNETPNGKLGLASSLTLDLDFVGDSKLSDLIDFIMELYGDAAIHNATLSNTFEVIPVSDEELDKQVNSYHSICGNQNSCDMPFGNISRVPINNPVCHRYMNCSCEPECIETGTCCADFIIRHRPYSCFSRSSILQFRPTLSDPLEDHVVADDASCYSFVDKCMNQSVWRFNSQFTESQLELLSTLPVRHERTTYRNISYMMCNVKDYRTIHIDITFQCDTLLENSLLAGLSNLRSLTRIAKQYCRSVFISDRSKLSPPSYDAQWGFDNTVSTPSLIEQVAMYGIPTSMVKDRNFKPTQKPYNKCNETGIWREGDSNIISVCEDDGFLGTSLPEYRINGLFYKNYACYICNPEIDPAMFVEENVISSCNITGFADDHNEPLDDAETLCRETPQQTRWLPFQNYYCSRCNLPGVATIRVAPTFPGFNTGMVFDRTQQTAYRTLFSLSFADLSRFSNEREIPDCTNGTYDYALDMCRPLYCRSGRILQNDTCKSLLDNGKDLSYNLAITLNITNEGDRPPGINSTGCESQQFQTTEKLDLVQVVKTFSIAVSEATRMSDPDIAQHLTGCQIATDIHCLHPNSGSDTLVYINMLTEIRLQCTLFVFTTSNRTSLESVIVDKLTDSYKVSTVSNNTVCLTATPRKSWLEDVDFWGNSKCFHSESPNLFLMSQPFDVDRLFTCVQIRLEDTEFDISNETGDLTLTSSNIVIGRDYFKVNGSGAMMCLKDYTMFTSTVNNTDIAPVDRFLEAYSIYSQVCTLLSMLCLLVTFVTYCLFQSMRTVPGKNNMALCFCLFCAQGTLHFGLSANDTGIKSLCTIIGMLIHYFWLATFFAMNVCSFHMFRVFCSNAMSVPSSSKRRFSKYLLYIFGMPILIVTTTFTVYFVSSEGDYSGYGESRCFLTNIYGIMSAFIVPSSIIFVTNIIFFITAFHKIRTSPRIQSSGDKREFFLYVKLCTVVGVTWPLQIVDAMLPLTIFSFFVVGLNASQGVFVCISYVCNRRVMFKYRGICSKDKTILSSGTAAKSNSTELTDRSIKQSA